MEFNEAAIIMEEGFCLWVGAGLSRQISGGYADVPLWEKITKDLEKDARLEIVEENDFPHRLQKCYDAIGGENFKRFLRKKYYTELCKANTSAPNTFVGELDVALWQALNAMTSFPTHDLFSTFR